MSLPVFPFLLISCGAAFASPATLILDEAAGDNEIQIMATVNDTLMDTATTIYSGTIKADVKVESGKVTEFEMVGGRLIATDTSFLFEIPMLFSQTASFVDLKATPFSPNGREILSTVGEFSAPEHFFRFDEGCVALAGDFGNSKSDVMDDPFDAAGTTVGTMSLSSPEPVLSSLTNKVIATRYDAAFSLPLNATTSDTDETITLARTTTGTVTATGVVMDYVNPFYEWAAANAPEAGEGLAFEADADDDGVVDGISWALGFAVDDPQKTLEVSFDPVAGGITFALPGETQMELTVQRSPSLAPGSWTDISASNLSTAANPILAGTSGSIEVTGPVGETFFLRLMATFE